MKKLLILCLAFTFAIELEVEGNLKVTGSVDASGNPITNVGEPVLTTDVATANYVLQRTSGKGRIITLKCPWFSGCNCGSNYNCGCAPEMNTCEVALCPDGWDELALSNEVISIATFNSHTKMVGNSVRYCIEPGDAD